LNIFTTIHFYFFVNSEEFFTVLCSTMEAIRDFGGRSDEGQDFARLILYSLVSTIQSKSHVYADQPLGLSPHWENMLALAQICKEFIFGCPDWASKGRLQGMQERKVMMVGIDQNDDEWQVKDIIKKSKERQAQMAARREEHKAFIKARLGEINELHKAAKEGFVIVRDRLLNQKKIPFHRTQRDINDYGLHWKISGEPADTPILRKLIAFFQAGGYHVRPAFSNNASAAEKDWRERAISEYGFWVDADKVLSVLNRSMVELDVLTYRRLSHLVKEFMGADSTRSRSGLLDVIGVLEREHYYAMLLDSDDYER